jgi:hypothetical protein
MNNLGKSSLADCLVVACVAFVVLGIAIPFALAVIGGGRGDSYNVQVTQGTAAAEGLDLQAVGAMVTKAESAEDLEEMINTPDINNIDLDADGVVDYIEVDEYGSGDTRGFSLTTEFEAGEVQEIATIDIAKVGDEADVEIHGNEQVYGHNRYYRSHFGLTDALLIGYLFSSHRPYSSPWGYNSYPRGYQRPPTTSTDHYNRRASAASSGTSFAAAQQSSLTNKASSPNSGKSSSKIKAPLRNPTASQKTFQARSTSKPKASGGFGRSKSSSSVRQSSMSRSGTRSGGK